MCNDGSPAAYYVSDQMQVEDYEGVVVYLQEGGGCASVDDCNARCQVSSPGLCTEDTNQEHDLDYTMWSQDPEENPPFHNFYKVFVPYCSSDVYTGTRNASEETGNYYFHGKFIVEALLEDMLVTVPGIHSIKQFVLTGGSAGAFGVGFNCDFVSEFLQEELGSQLDVRCIADGGDFYPAWLSKDDCDPYLLGEAASVFWSSQLDSSCVVGSGPGSHDCLIFPTYFQYIDTPMMVVSNYVDTSMEVHPCTPPVDQDSQFWDTWREEMMILGNNFIQSKPLNGLFLSNCPFHVSVLKEFAWGDMDVLLADREGSEVLKNVIKNWLEMTGPYQAMDFPTHQNDKCPYSYERSAKVIATTNS